jgi:hypothetical protein
MDGLAEVHARIRVIESQFGMGASSAGGVLGTSAPSDASATTGTAATDSSSGDFASQLASAQSTQNADPSVPAQSGTLNRAGVDPVKWARDFLTKVGVPITKENVRAITAWEQAEGTAARFNPLATTQSGYAGETQFNSVGVKNYVSYQDGIDANAKVLQNGLYGNILDALRQGNDALAVARAIKSSPWGTGGLVEKILQSGE